MGTKSIHPIFDEWLAVQGEAQQADMSVMRAEIGYGMGSAPRPSAEEREHARLLRLRANALLKEALAEMTRLARAASWKADQ